MLTNSNVNILQSSEGQPLQMKSYFDKEEVIALMDAQKEAFPYLDMIDIKNDDMILCTNSKLNEVFNMYVPVSKILFSPECLNIVGSWTKKLAKLLKVCGLMKYQNAIATSCEVFLLEDNPRASRTVPFVSKAIGHPLAKYASLVISGKSLEDISFTEEMIPRHVSVKEVVLPFEKFQGCDVLLRPEMRSTGKVMGIAYEFSTAFAKAYIATGQKLPVSGTMFLSLNDTTKMHLVKIARAYLDIGFKIVSTSGNAHVLKSEGVPVERVLKMYEGRPNAGDMVANGQIHLMVVTSLADSSLDQADGVKLRRMALAYKVPIVNKVVGALVTADAIKSLKPSSDIEMVALQDFFLKDDDIGTVKNLLFVCITSSL